MLNQVLWFNKFIQINKKPVFYKKCSSNNINFLMRLVDRNGVFKNWNIPGHKYYLKNNLHFQWMQLTSATSSNCKNIIKQNNNINTFTTTQHHFIRNSRVLTVQIVTSKELYWILITTIEHRPTSQKYFERKIHLTEFRLERNLHDTSHCIQ